MNTSFSSLLPGLTVPTHAGSFHVVQLPDNAAYYAGRDSSGAATLLVQASGLGRTVPLRLAGIEARFGVPCRVAAPGEPEREESLTAILCLSHDQGVEAYFAHVIDLLITVLGKAPSMVSIAVAIDELVELFQKLSRPARKTVTGLVGELLVIAAAPDASVAVSAWHSDPLERYDFCVGNLRIEAKASSTRERAHFLSTDQADPPAGVIAILSSVLVEAAGGGTSLGALVDLIEHRLSAHADIMRLRTIIADTLGSALTNALVWRFDLALAQSSHAWFNMRFVPAIRPPLPPFVSSVRFTTNLSNCPQLLTEELAFLDPTTRSVLPL